MRRYLILILLAIFECPTVYATVVVVEGVSRARSGGLRKVEDDAIEDAQKKALAQVINQMSDGESIRIRGALVENQLMPNISMVMKQWHVISKKREGDEFQVKLSADIDMGLLKELLRKEGFFRGRDSARVLVLMSSQDELVAHQSEPQWWWKDSSSGTPSWVAQEQIDAELERVFLSKGFIFVRGAELRLMDLMPVPFRVLKLDEPQLESLGRLFDVQYIFTGSAHSWPASNSGGQSFGELELSLRLYSVEYGQFIGRTVNREKVVGLTPTKALQDAATSLSSRAAMDLASQVEGKWNVGQGRQPTVLLRIKNVRGSGAYNDVYKLLKAAKTSVLSVAEYEQSRDEISFLVELKVQVEMFVRQTKSWSGSGLSFVGSAPEKSKSMYPVVELEWKG